MRKKSFKIAAILLILLSIGAKGLAQSALDGFDPGANGVISALAVQADGKILVGGSFTTLGGSGTIARSRIGRLNPDGTVDLSFNPGANGPVFALAVQADGKILVVGEFSSLGGATRNNIGRLNTDGTIDLSFDPGANSQVDAVAVQADGKVLVAGNFTTLGGGGFGTTTRNFIGRLNSADGTIDPTFNPGANGSVLTLTVQLDGEILAGGNFTGLGGGTGTVTRSHIGRILPDGTIDSGFDPGANSDVVTLAVQADGRILAGGLFTTLGGSARNFIGRLLPNGVLDSSFNPGADNLVRILRVQANGQILVGGDFTTLGGMAHSFIGRVNLDGTLDLSFNPNANSSVLSLGVQADGKILVGGAFSNLGGVVRNFIGRLYPDGTLDSDFNPGADASIFALATQPDGKIMVAGDFTQLGGTPLNRVGRLNPDGTIDTTFTPGTGADGAIRALVLQADGKIVVGGGFTNLGGTTRNHIGRLNSDGTLDPTFDPNADGNVLALAVQADDEILIGGDFVLLGGTTRNHIGRVTSDGLLDPNFDPGADARVNLLAVQALDNKILVTGDFTMLGGGGMGTTPRSRIGRLDATGTLDTNFNPGASDRFFALEVQADGAILLGGNFITLMGGGGQGSIDRSHIGRLLPAVGSVDNFNPGANDAVLALALQADGKILAGGNFTKLGGGGVGNSNRSKIGRLIPDGTVDSYDPGADNSVRAVTVQMDGKILIAGDFMMVGGGGTGTTARTRIARLTNDEAALQELPVDPTGTTISWLRSSGSPEVDRVTFELSTDGITYSPLPSPTRILGGWQLTGQSLTALQNLFIRARGFYSTAKPDGTGSIVETVRNAFITPAPVITSPSTATATKGQAFTYQIVATNSPTNFNATGLPAPLTVNVATGLISGTPAAAGTFTVTLSASNAGGTGTKVLTLTIKPAPPVITSPPTATATVGQPFTYQITATNSPTSFGATGLPAPLTVDPATGLISGTPAAAGTFTITLSASNAGGTGTKVLTLTVNPAPPVITSPLSATATVGQQFVYQILATQSPTRYDATNLPSDLTIDLALGIISGTPAQTQIGTFDVILSASNADGTGMATLTLTVQAPPASDIGIISGTSATGTTGSPFTFKVITKGTSPAAQLSATGLPPGLSLDPLSGVISGTPTMDGSFSVTLTVTDGSLTVTGTLELTFTSNPALPVIVSAQEATFVPGRAFSYTIAIQSTADRAATTFGLIGKENLPVGLTFDPIQGTVTGTPQASAGFQRRPLTSGGIPMAEFTATNASGTTTSPFNLFQAVPGAKNISTRLAVGTMDEVLIGGFIIQGNGPRKVLIRAIGPELTARGVTGALLDTTLELHHRDAMGNDVLLASNDNWQDKQPTDIENTGIPPTDPRESAIVQTLDPGLYTAILRGNYGSTGVGLVEVYDLGAGSLDVTNDSRLANISTRGKVATGDNVMIGGFIIPQGSVADVVARAIGTSLATKGVANPLQDPTLELHNGQGALIAGNDNWMDSPDKQIIIDNGLAPDDAKESALFATLTAGAYTAVVKSKDGTSGIALVEVYVFSNSQ